MADGIISCAQVTKDVKIERRQSRVIDLSATETNIPLLYDADRELVIEKITLLYVTETAAAASTLDIGTLADDDSVVDAYATSATATAVEANNATLPFVSTLFQAYAWPGAARPILPKNTRLIANHTASGGAGEIVLVVLFYPRDRGHTNE